MASEMTTDIDVPDGRYILIATDFGTTYGATSYAVMGDANPIKVVHIDFKSGVPQVPVIFAQAQAGNRQVISFGTQLDTRIWGSNVQEGDVIRLLKMALSEEDHAQEVRAHIVEQLQGLNIGNGKVGVEQLIEFYFRAISEKVNAKLKAITSSRLDQLPQKWLLSVPQMWTPLQNRTMMSAAKAAGLPSCSLVSEPECIAAYYLAEAQQEDPDHVPIEVSSSSESLVLQLMLD